MKTTKRDIIQKIIRKPTEIAKESGRKRKRDDKIYAKNFSYKIYINDNVNVFGAMLVNVFGTMVFSLSARFDMNACFVLSCHTNNTCECCTTKTKIHAAIK